MSDMGFIYALIDPRDKSIRYVGKSRKEPLARLLQHWNCPTNERMANWFADLKCHGARPLLIILEQPPIEKLAQCEWYWMAALTTHKISLLNAIPDTDRSSWQRQTPWSLPNDLLLYSPDSPAD